MFKNNSNNILFITGGCGFIGSNFINYIMKQYDKIKLLILMRCIIVLMKIILMKILYPLIDTH